MILKMIKNMLQNILWFFITVILWGNSLIMILFAWIIFGMTSEQLISFIDIYSGDPRVKEPINIETWLWVITSLITFMTTTAAHKSFLENDDENK